MIGARDPARGVAAALARRRHRLRKLRRTADRLLRHLRRGARDRLGRLQGPDPSARDEALAERAAGGASLLPQRRWRPRATAPIRCCTSPRPRTANTSSGSATREGLGGDTYAYRLTVRRPRPDFRLTVAPRNPNVPVGGAVPVTVTAFRMDGFDGAIDVALATCPRVCMRPAASSARAGLDHAHPERRRRREARGSRPAAGARQGGRTGARRQSRGPPEADRADAAARPRDDGRDERGHARAGRHGRDHRLDRAAGRTFTGACRWRSATCRRTSACSTSD